MKAEWNPILTAPRGKNLIVYDPFLKAVRAEYTGGRWRLIGSDRTLTPTHWMLPPEPPKRYPITPGFYWYRSPGGSEWKPVEVLLGHGNIFYCKMLGDGNVYRLDKLTGDWNLSAIWDPIPLQDYEGMP